MSTSSYRADGGTQRGHLDIAHFITTPQGDIAGRVLVVDDLADTGHTLRAVLERLRAAYPGVVEMRTAVLWVKRGSTFVPDFHVERLADDPWIHQPFETYDSLDIDELLARHEPR
jgi:hypoxanthine phosphoribosyltransferase